MASESHPPSIPATVSVGVSRVVPPLVVLSVLLGAWQLFVVLAGVPTVILPSPVEVGAAIVDALPILIADAAVTAATAGLGLVAGIAVGFVLAFAMTYSRTAAAVGHPFVLGLRIAPLVAIAPLLFLWFGHGIPARALLVSTLTVFPVTIASLDGLRAVPREYLDAARSVGASPLTVFVRVRVPAAAASVFAGIKLAGALSVVGAVVAEFVTLNAGLGYRIFRSSTTLQTPRMFAALVLLVVVGFAFYAWPALFEQRAQWEA